MAVFTSKINDGYSVHLEVTQGAQNIGANSSTVNYKLYVTKASNYTGRYSPYTGRAYSVVINGTTVENGTWTYDFRGHSSLTVVSGSTTVPHNSDGKKTVSVSGSVYLFDVGTGKPSGSLALTAIPRSSTLTSFSNFATNATSISFGLDKKYSSYTHDVVLKFGTTNIRTWTGQSLGATGNSVRTLALDTNDRANLLARMPSTTSGSVTLVVTTKNGTTTIGTSQRSATVTVDSTRVPTITNISVVAQTKAGRISGTTATYVVQNVGTIKCSYTTTPGLSSSIRSAVIKANDSTFNSRDQTWTPKTSGSNTITIEVTDTRGRVTRATRTVNVIPYSPISATLSSLTRRSDNKLSAVTKVSNAPIKNGTTNMGRYRVRIYTTPTDKSSARSNVYTKNHTGVGHTNNSETHIPTTIYDTHKTYDTEVVVEDDYSVVSLRGTLPTASYPFVMSRYGAGVGKIPEGSRVLDVGGQIWDRSSNTSRNLSGTVDTLDAARTAFGTMYNMNSTLLAEGHLPRVAKYYPGANTTDFNDIENEWALAAKGGANSPPGMTTSFVYLHTIHYSFGGNRMQIAYPYSNVTDPPQFRVRVSNSWTGWQKLVLASDMDSQLVNGKDMNTVTETGFYRGYNMTNAAVQTISTFIVNKYSPDWIDQIQITPGAVSKMYIRSRHSGTTWGAWQQLALASDTNNPGLGGVVESGNGYTRLADGTQMCWGSVTVSTTAVAWGNMFRSGLIYFTFPKSFLSIPTCTLSFRRSNDYNAWDMINNISTTGGDGYLLRATGATLAGALHFTAIGRWK